MRSLQAHALAEEAHHHERRERGEQRDVERLAAGEVEEGRRGVVGVVEIEARRVAGRLRSVVGRLRAGYAREQNRQRERAEQRAADAYDARREGHCDGGDAGVRYAFAIRRDALRIARLALVIEIVARATASTSAPTLNESRMLLPLNCAANSGGSTEK